MKLGGKSGERYRGGPGEENGDELYQNTLYSWMWFSKNKKKTKKQNNPTTTGHCYQRVLQTIRS